MSATEATIQTFEFKIVAPKNETITVTMGDGTVYTVKGTDTESVTKDDLRIAYGTKWSATVSAEGNSSGTEVASSLCRGQFNTSEIYYVEIPDDVSQVHIGGHFGPHHIRDKSQTFYINGEKLIREGSQSDRPSDVPVTPGSIITIRALGESSTSNEEDFQNEWGVYAAQVSSDTINPGNLKINDIDIGSTSSNGTVTDKIFISAAPANVDSSTASSTKSFVLAAETTDLDWIIKTIDFGKDNATYLVHVEMWGGYIASKPIDMRTEDFSVSGSGIQKIYFNGGGADPDNFDSIENGTGSNDGTSTKAFISVIDKATGKIQGYTLENSHSHTMFSIIFTKQS